MLYHGFNNYKMIPVLVALIAAIVTQGCARHSSENIDKSALRFYGNPTMAMTLFMRKPPIVSMPMA